MESKKEKAEASGADPLPESNTYEPYVEYLHMISREWSSWGAAQLLTADLLRYLAPRYHFCSTPIKIRILTSFLYLKSQLREEWVELLSQLLSEAESDRDDWVRKLARLLQPFIATGRVDLKETDTETAYKVIECLDEYKSSTAGAEGNNWMKPPLESEHMCNVMSHDDFPSRFRIAGQTDSATSSCSAQPVDHQLPQLPPSLQSVRFTVPPAYKNDTPNFRASLDCNSFMRVVERHGMHMMAKAELDYERRRQNAGRRAAPPRMAHAMPPRAVPPTAPSMADDEKRAK